MGAPESVLRHFHRAVDEGARSAQTDRLDELQSAWSDDILRQLLRAEVRRMGSAIQDALSRDDGVPARSKSPSDLAHRRRRV